jgi:hypothetical protein
MKDVTGQWRWTERGHSCPQERSHGLAELRGLEGMARQKPLKINA